MNREITINKAGGIFQRTQTSLAEEEWQKWLTADAMYAKVGVTVGFRILGIMHGTHVSV
jgi:hypothetical protein